MPRTITHAMVWTHSNVSTFKGYSVNAQGEVELSETEYVDVLNDIYGDVTVCGMSYGSGSLLVDADPCTFRLGKGDYESELTCEFCDALENEDDSWITFAEYEPFEIDDEE